MAKYSEIYLPPTVKADVPLVYIPDGKGVYSPSTLNPSPVNSSFGLFGEDVFVTTNTNWPVFDASPYLNIFGKSVLVQFWFHATSFNTNASHLFIFADNRTSSATVQLACSFNSSGSININSWTSTLGYITSVSSGAGQIALNNWYYVSYHYDHINSVYSLYLDGVLTITATGDGYAKDVNTVLIPGGIWNGFSGYSLLGYMADFKVVASTEALNPDHSIPTARGKLGVYAPDSLSSLSPGATKWTPSQISTTAWFDASSSQTLTLVDGLVSQWSDLSGNGNHATQSTASNRPFYTTGTSLYFDGTDDNLTYPFTVTVSTVFTYVIVFRHVDVNAGTPSFARSPANFGLHYTPASNYYWMYTSAGVTTPILDGGVINSGIKDKWRIIVGQGTVSTTGTYTVMLGGDPFETSRRMTGAISEVLLVPEQVDASTLDKLVGYLAHKWGLTSSLPANHPYKLNPPMV